MFSTREVAEHLIKLTGLGWKENDGGISACMESYPYSDGRLDGAIEEIKTAYPSLKRELSITELTDAGRIISSTADRPERPGVKVERFWDQPKPIRVTISNEIVKKIAEALCFQQKVAEHLTNLTGIEWKIKGGGVFLSDSWQSDISAEFEEAVKIVTERYLGYFSEIPGKWDRSVFISIKGVEAIAKLIAT